MNYIYDKLTATYNWLAEYYQQNNDYQNLSKEDRITVLRKTLQQKCAFPEEVNGKIEMQFTKLVQNPTYQSFSFTLNKPIQYPSNQLTKSTKTICFTGKILFQSDKIKCPLKISCLFEQTFPTTLPKVYIEYPTLPTKTQNGQILSLSTVPNSQFVQIVSNKSKIKECNYRARTGGIQVIFCKKQEKMTIKQLVDQTIQLMKKQFPFLKSKSQSQKVLNSQINSDQQTYKIYQLSKKLQQQLLNVNQIILQKDQNLSNCDKQQIQGTVSIIRRGQQLDILLKSIESEIKEVKQENNKMLEVLSEAEKQSQKISSMKNLSQYYPFINQNHRTSKLIHQTLADYQAIKDCLFQFQRLVKNPNEQKKSFSIEEYKKHASIFQEFNEKLFYQKIILNRLVQKQKQKQQQYSNQSNR